ncbi:hypothetical protein KKC45_02095 [Patescibacteria group bacterium]|nr:hypothetical protein [Patescibacteria group bacterium]
MMGQLRKPSQEEIIEVANIVLGHLLKLPVNPKTERKGGYFNLLDVWREEGSAVWQKKPLMIIEIGECHPDLLEAFYVGQEKTTRLFSHLPDNHISSWESRNVHPELKQKQYGGAVVTPYKPNIGSNIRVRKMGSFSGLNEHRDEAFLLPIWLYFHWMTYVDVLKIVKISDNPILGPLLESSNKELCMRM